MNSLQEAESKNSVSMIKVLVIILVAIAVLVNGYIIYQKFSNRSYFYAEQPIKVASSTIRVGDSVIYTGIICKRTDLENESVRYLEDGEKAYVLDRAVETSSEGCESGVATTLAIREGTSSGRYRIKLEKIIKDKRDKQTIDTFYSNWFTITD